MTEIYQCNDCQTMFFKCDIEGGRCGYHPMCNGTVSCPIADTSDRQRIAELEQKLAGMTAERDAAVDLYKTLDRAYDLSFSIVEPGRGRLMECLKTSALELARKAIENE